MNIHLYIHILFKDGIKQDNYGQNEKNWKLVSDKEKTPIVLQIWYN